MATIDEKKTTLDYPAGDTSSAEEHGAFQDVTIDPKEEVKLLAKLDLFLVPIIMLVYLSCFLDRSNIGNVKVAVRRAPKVTQGISAVGRLTWT